MKRYITICEQGTSFRDYTVDEPETAQEIRSHFWGFDEARTTHFKYFTLDYIQEAWQVTFYEVIK